MRNLLLGATLLAAVGTTPAMAANTALTMWTSGNIGDAVTATGFNSVDIGPQDLDGVTVTLSFANRTTSPNQLTSANINIDNTSDVSQTFNVLAGANQFLGPSAHFTLSGTVLAALGVGDLKGNFLVDGGDGLNGTSITPVGTSIGTFDSGSLLGPHSFSFNGNGFDLVNGPYGMGELLSLTLAPGASVAVQSLSMTAGAVPEPRTWAMLIVGFGLMALMSVKKVRKDRLGGALV